MRFCKRPRTRLIGGLGIAVLLSVLIWFGYTLRWTGFGEYVELGDGRHPAKTLWDWMELILIPVVLAVGAAWFNQRREKLAREIEHDRLREEALQNYFERMAEFMLKERLRKSEPDDEVRAIARAMTLTVLRGLDERRKGTVVRFLHESELIVTPMAAIDLRDADLRNVNLRLADLTSVVLNKSDLRGANLDGVDLSKAVLKSSDLRGSDLSGGILSEAILDSAKLNNAILRNTLLREARLSRADLTEADLRGANLQQAGLGGPALLFKADLREAKLCGADCAGISLREADLRNSDLRGCRLVKAVLCHAKLGGAHLGNWTFDVDEPLRTTDLCGADLRDAVGLTQQQLDSAFGNRRTQLPKGLNYPNTWDMSPES